MRPLRIGELQERAGAPDHLPETDAAFEKMRAARLAGMSQTTPLPDMPRTWQGVQTPDENKFFFLATPQEFADVDAETLANLRAAFQEKINDADAHFGVWCERIGASWQITNISRIGA